MSSMLSVKKCTWIFTKVPGPQTATFHGHVVNLGDVTTDATVVPSLRRIIYNKVLGRLSLLAVHNAQTVPSA